MASVKISKNGMVKEVSVSTFENFFKNSGWEIAGDKKPATSQSKKKEVKEVDLEPAEDNNDDEWAEAMKDDDSEDEGIEKPLSEMNKKELMEYAEKNGISLAGLNTNAQFRQAIQDYMKED